VAGSDFEVQPQQTASIPIGLTPLGVRLVSGPDGYRGYVLLSLKDYGLALPSTPTGPPASDQFVYLRLLCLVACLANG
jgi:hypothetical protein